VAKPTTTIRKGAGCRCCSALPMLALAAVTKRPSRRSRPVPRVRPCHQCHRCRSGSPSERSRSRLRPTTRYPSMPAGPLRRDWTPTVARHLLLRRHRATIIWISRPSCAGNQTEVCNNSDDGNRSRPMRPGPLFLAWVGLDPSFQATDFKRLTMYSVIGWPLWDGFQTCRNLVNPWRKCGIDWVTIRKKA
jgi:hypothetical protein